MKRVLVTGLSGTGKSTVVGSLASRGFHAVDADQPGLSELVAAGPGEVTGVGGGQEWMWREDRITALLAQPLDGDLFVGGCSPNQGRFTFDHIILLTVPPEVMAHRLSTRTTNWFGKDAGELERSLALRETVEPLLRRSADLEIDTTAPLDAVIDTILGHVARL